LTGKFIKIKTIMILDSSLKSEADTPEIRILRQTFKVYGEVNSVKNTTINIWLNDGVY